MPSTAFWLRVRSVTFHDGAVARGPVRVGRLAVGDEVDVVFGRCRERVPVLALVTATGGVPSVGPDDGIVNVVLPDLDRMTLGPGAVLATPGTVHATGTAELVVQVLAEYPLRVELSAHEVRRRIEGLECAQVLGGVVSSLLRAERARPDPDPERFFEALLARAAELAPELLPDVRGAALDLAALPGAALVQSMGAQGLFFDFDGTVVRGRPTTRLRPPGHPGAVVHATVTLSPPIVLADEPVAVLGTSGSGWSDWRIGWVHVRASTPALVAAGDQRCPFVPLEDRATFLPTVGLSEGFVDVFLRGSFLSFDAGPVEDAWHATDDWSRWPALHEHRWCPLTWGNGGGLLVRAGDDGPRFARFERGRGLTEDERDEEHVFREEVVQGVLRELEATGWFDTEPEELGELGREDLQTADGSEPPTPIRTRRLHLAERVQDALRRLDLPYRDRLLDPSWAVDPS